jgi:hypothetical protein
MQPGRTKFSSALWRRARSSLHASMLSWASPISISICGPEQKLSFLNRRHQAPVLLCPGVTTSARTASIVSVSRCVVFFQDASQAHPAGHLLSGDNYKSISPHLYPVSFTRSPLVLLLCITQRLTKHDSQ